jgi:hypothetical protein
MEMPAMCKRVADLRSPIEELVLVTQMRAGTHFLCGALRVALEATIYRPDRERQYIVMDDEYILRGLHEAGRPNLPRPNGTRKIYFNHYYHSQFRKLPEMPHLYLIGFPFDSFYSDGVVASQAMYDPGPSGPRAGKYVLRFDSPEWRFLAGRMRENADWLMEISESQTAMIVRYEDLCTDFEGCEQRLAAFLGGFVNPLPRPVINPRRSYWTQDYSGAFDSRALSALWDLFASPIERFYPERLDSLRAAVHSAPIGRY